MELALLWVYAALMLAGAIAIVRRPHRAILILIVLLPVHSLGMVLIFHFVRPQYLYVFQGWKDAVIALGLLRVVFGPSNLGKRRLHILDVLVVFLCGLALVTIPLHSDVDLRTQLFALRNDFLFGPLYVIGRLTVTDTKSRHQVLVTMAWVGIILTGIAIVEYFVNPIPTLVSLELPGYINANFGFRFALSDGIPYAYFTGSGARRMGSLFLSSVDLSEFGAVTLAAGAALLFGRPRRTRLGWAALLAGLLAPVLAIGRAELVMMPLLVILIALVAHRYSTNLPTIASVVLIAGVAIGFILVFPFGLLSDSNLVADASTRSHIGSLSDAVNLAASQPFGLGLGTAGLVGARTSATGGEGQLLTLISGLGDIGLLLCGLILVTGIVVSTRAARASEDRAMPIAAAITLASVALTFPVAEVLANIVVVVCTFWCLGQVVSLVTAPRPKHVATLHAIDLRSAHADPA